MVLKLDPSGLWSCLFFLMLFTLGIDSQFCGVESLMTGLVDNWPDYLRPRKIKFTFVMVIIMFVLGIPMITNGGVYIFQLMDFYAASGMSLLWCVFFQTIAICWMFGGKKMYDCIEEMVGFRINWYWYICWMATAPAFMVVRTHSLCLYRTEPIYVLVVCYSLFSSFTSLNTFQLRTARTTRIQSGARYLDS